MRYMFSGIDPGIVTTGVVTLSIDSDERVFQVFEKAFTQEKLPMLEAWVPLHGSQRIFIEAYEPRSNFGHDTRMAELVKQIADKTGGKVISNKGVKKVIRKKLMEHLGLWNFQTQTHHQDLRSAAYIMLYGMVKDEVGNQLLTQIVWDHLFHDDWGNLTP